jgi:hypothetical protein
MRLGGRPRDTGLMRGGRGRCCGIRVPQYECLRFATAGASWRLSLQTLIFCIHSPFNFYLAFEDRFLTLQTLRSSWEMSDDDLLSKRRASLIEQKKRELDEACDTHDSLVCLGAELPVLAADILFCEQLRELFHLHKFITLIGFDPHVRC